MHRLRVIPSLFDKDHGCSLFDKDHGCSFPLVAHSLSSSSVVFYIGLLLYFRGMWKSYSRAGGKLKISKEIDPKIEKVANSSL
jgi:hypothetical protein